MPIVLLVIALALPPVPREALDPPGTCVGASDTSPELWFFPAEDYQDWRLWASQPAWTTGLDAQGAAFPATISLTQTVTLAPGATFANAFAEGPEGQAFTFYACAPGDLPPGGGWRIFAADVRG